MEMAYLCSLLFFNCRYLKLYRRGILALPNEIQKLSCTVPNLKCTPCLASVVKYCSTDARRNLQPKLNININNLQFCNKIEDLRLSQLLRDKNLNEGMIINTFMKFIGAYHGFKNQRGFEEKLNFYLESPSFIKFFKVIDKELIKFSLSSLLMLYELKDVKTPRTEALLKKVFKCLEENFKTYSLSEKIQIYTTTVNNFPTDSDTKSIIDICEDYFKRGLEDDLEYMKFTGEVVEFLNCNELPLFVSQMIAEKLADDIFKASHEKRSAGRFFVLVGENPQLLRKNTLQKLFEVAVKFLSHSVMLKTVSQIYSNCVFRDESFYNQDLVNLLMKTALSSNKLQITTEAVYILRIGYLDENFVKSVVKSALNRVAVNCPWPLLLSLANILVQVSADKTMLDCAFEECKQYFEEYDFYNSVVMSSTKKRRPPIMDLYCSWVTYLTYLGCDTRALLNDFFELAKINLIHFKSLRELLLLHLVAKAYFPNMYTSLSPDIVKKLIRNEFEWNDHYTNLDECFDKDCLLRHCVNSSRHFFHFVALFGPDNKPINLSDYKSKQLRLPPKEYFDISYIDKPPGSKLIAFQENIHAYRNEFRNVPKKCGFYQLYKKAFEDSGCEIVLLPPSFFHLELEDKKKFLNKEINEILGVSENSQ